MGNHILTSIKEFVAAHQWVDISEITDHTRIEEDLGITGDDASELLVAFGKKFNVDVSHFMFDEYFNPEGTNWFRPTYVPNKKILTIAHLEKAVITGKLDESVING
ncbi:MAG: hypothetical protein BGO69_13535 [Bacteroidetes bacterium 46-16]|nr:MAG: hypothetical protein BGO69_13535 [Bacteroidetes bacterium 46-16]